LISLLLHLHAAVEFFQKYVYAIAGPVASNILTHNGQSSLEGNPIYRAVGPVAAEHYTIFAEDIPQQIETRFVRGRIRHNLAVDAACDSGNFRINIAFRKLTKVCFYSWTVAGSSRAVIAGT
jgi:hypothetical protein